MHPLNKKFFGNGPNALVVQFFNGSAVVSGWILKQMGSVRYRVTDGQTTKIVRLAQNDAEMSSLLNGSGSAAESRNALCTIQMKKPDNSIGYVRKFSANYVYFTDNAPFQRMRDVTPYSPPSGPPANALGLHGEPLLLNGEYLVLN